MLQVNDDNGDIYIGTTYFAAGNGNIYRFKKDGTFIEKFDCCCQFFRSIIFQERRLVQCYVLQIIDPANSNEVTNIGHATYMAADDDVVYLINSLTNWNVNPAVTTNHFSTYNIKTKTLNQSSTKE